MADKGVEADARHWAGRVSREYRMLLLEEGEEKTREVVDEEGEKVMEEQETGGLKSALRVGAMLRWKVRYFTDGAADVLWSARDLRKDVS